MSMKTLSVESESVLDLAINELRHSQWSERLDDLIIADLEMRSAVGEKKYGTILKTHNGRNALIDAYEELLDALLYQTQYVTELEDAGHGFGDEVLDENRHLLDIIMEALRKAAGLLLMRDGKGLLAGVEQPAPKDGWSKSGYRIPNRGNSSSTLNMEWGEEND
jgi:hypothetical protein